MEKSHKEMLQSIAHTIRGLSMDAIQKAESGHPGLPLGCAEIGAVLMSDFLRYNPQNPLWFNRDRFILSAGHGSMLLYAMLHLSGYDLSLEEIEKFRQLNSRTPGHPERLDTPGVEVTTGPLGQGIANAVGMALAYKLLGERLNRDGFPIVSNTMVCLAGDGCLMEGISHEASSLAGHLGLNNLILLYDMNHVTLDGRWEESCSDNVSLRYASYGWDVLEVRDANDIEQVFCMFRHLRHTKMERPTIVICHTIIGKGAVGKEDSPSVHGAPLGEKIVEATKARLGISLEQFCIPSAVVNFFKQKKHDCIQLEQEWNCLLARWKEAYPDCYRLFVQLTQPEISHEIWETIASVPSEEAISGRKISQMILKVLQEKLPHLFIGSADLSHSDCTYIEGVSIVKSHDFHGSIAKYGVREFAMTAISNGMSTAYLRPVIGTFLCFSDYARPAIRLGCLSQHPTILIYTHDSVWLGEDGPTHQPIEHLSAPRAMPNMYLFRPGDAHEVKAAYWWLLHHQNGPVALVLTRQSIPLLPETTFSLDSGPMKGGYILIDGDTSRSLDFVLCATGSELHLAASVAKDLQKKGKNVRVVSIPCFRLFDEQPLVYRRQVLGDRAGKMVSIEAGASFGWEKYIGRDGIPIHIDHFGKSAPMDDLMRFWGFTVDQIVNKLLCTL